MKSFKNDFEKENKFLTYLPNIKSQYRKFLFILNQYKSNTKVDPEEVQHKQISLLFTAADNKYLLFHLTGRRY